MKSWHLCGKENIKIVDIPIPEPGQGEVQIRVQACGICSHSDLCYYLYCGERRGCVPGMIFGHEVSGYITKIGEGVKGWILGERIFARTVSGFGGFSEYCTINHKYLGKLPEHMTYIEGAAAQQLPIAINATRMIELGDNVAIFGQGSCGLLLLQVARLRGASKIIVSDWFSNRLEMGKKFGADIVFNAREEKICEKILNEFSGGADVCIDAVGTPTSLRNCFSCVKQGGKVTIFGTYYVDNTVCLDIYEWQKQIPTIYMGHEAGINEVEKCLRISERLMLEKKVDVSSYISDIYEFIDLPRALKILQKNPALLPESDLDKSFLIQGMEAIKIILKIGEDAFLKGNIIGTRFEVFEKKFFKM